MAKRIPAPQVFKKNGKNCKHTRSSYPPHSDSSVGPFRMEKYINSSDDMFSECIFIQESDF